MLPLTDEQWLKVIRAALAEDVGTGDVTTQACIPADARLVVQMVARESLVVSGMRAVELTFLELDPAMQFRRGVADGTRVSNKGVLLEIEGSARAILTAERVALNILQRLSGVATATARFVDMIRGTQAKILDTRKTTPGLRLLEKYAVLCGGGVNHRIGLYDQVLIKDNHLAALAHEQPNAVAASIDRARTQFPTLKVEVEADTLEQVQQAAEAKADIVLLDNMAPALLKAAVQIIAGRCVTEASGGVNLETVRAIAESGVDFISIGAITHSARAVDIGLDFVSGTGAVSAR